MLVRADDGVLRRPWPFIFAVVELDVVGLFGVGDKRRDIIR